MYELVCEKCKKEFTSKHKRKFCTDSCKVMFYRVKNNPHQHTDKKCEKCGKEYKGTYSSKFCSKECGYVEKECMYCENKFLGHRNRKFCSDRCKDSYKVRKPTGETEFCLVCGEEYKTTYGKKKIKKKVCSVKCANILVSSKSGKIVTITQIEDVIRNSIAQPTALIIAEKLNTSHTTVIERAKEFYGSFREMIVAITGTYLVIEDDKSYTSNYLFMLIDNLYKIQGIREKTFPDLINPFTKAFLRIDYFINELPLAIEYHGIQHYKEIDFFNSSKVNSLTDRMERDKIKEDYLLTRNIPLVIFNYKDKINEQLIKSKLDNYFK
ncbi:hypothetical protein AAHH67_16095 [Niallia circulans]